MFNRHSSFMKVSALSALAAFSLTSLRTTPAGAYSYDTHSRIAELAVHAMQPLCFGTAPGTCTPSLLLAPPHEDDAWNAYLTAVRAAPAKLALLRTGLPTSRVDGGYSPIPGDSDDATGYPYNANSTAETCNVPVTETLDLNRLNDFRIVDLKYFPKRDSKPCGLETPLDNLVRAQADDATDPTLLTQRVTELVLGWHAGGVDDHLNDAALWVRPTLVGYWGVIFEAASWVWEAAVGTILLPFALLWSLFSGDDISLDSSYALARQYNPVDEIQGAIPGIGDIRSDTYTGLWHHEAVDAGVNRFNDTRGMWYPGAGPDHPGAVDVTILALTQVTGLSLNANIADGPGNYGGFDKIHRTWPQWQAHSVGMLEWSPLHNLAAYGWARFKSDPSNAVGLGWPLHAIGDASEPHHVTATTAWGHVPYEKFIEQHLTTYMAAAFDKTGRIDGAQAALDQQLIDALYTGFRWWKQFSNGEDMQALIHDLAVETRQEIKDENEWPYKDSYSTDEALGIGDAVGDYGADVLAGHEEHARRLLNNGIGAAIAVLAVAAQKVPAANATLTPPPCPPNQFFGFERHTKHVQPSRGAGYDQIYSVPKCGPKPAANPPNVTPESQGIAQIGGGTCLNGAICTPNGGACSNALACASGVCVAGKCGKPSGTSCAVPGECASGVCSAQHMCVSPNGSTCTTGADCSSGACSAQGICGQPTGAGCGANAECASNQCSEGGVCLGANGDPCTSAAQCASGTCNAGICGALPNGELCTTASQCASNECSEGHCGKGYREPCADSSECSNDNCIDGLCGPGG